MALATHRSGFPELWQRLGFLAVFVWMWLLTPHLAASPQSEKPPRVSRTYFGVCGTRTSGDSFACRVRLAVSFANCSWERAALAAVT